jgi:hypothetical protein
MITVHNNTNQVDLALVQYDNGEHRVVNVCDWERIDSDEPMEGLASEWLSADDFESPLLDYDLSQPMSRAEMQQIDDLDGCKVVRSEQFGNEVTV